MYQDVIIAGNSGQGILLIGNLLAHAGMESGLHVSVISSYEVEKHDYIAICTVVISDEPIGASIVNRPMSIIAMNEISLARFQGKLRPSGIMVINSSQVKTEVVDSSKKAVLIPIDKIAYQNIANPKLANMVALGALLKATNFLSLGVAQKALVATIPKQYHHLLLKKRKALTAGYNYQD